VARKRHEELATQVAAFFDLRNKPKAPLQVAEADAPPVKVPAPQTAARAEIRVASLATPASSPEAPMLKSAPQLVREVTHSPPPTEAERGRLNTLVTLASLTTPPIADQRPQAADRSGLARLISASVEEPAAPQAAPAAAPERLAALVPEPSSSSAPTAPVAETTDGWAPAPQFDEDHPEELSYRPFPIAPFLTQSASADDDALVTLVHPDIARTLELLGDSQGVLPLRLRPGKQAAEVMWAQQFRGDAVDISVLDDAERAQRAPSSIASRSVRTTSR
jgi:hypothetical protein